MLIFDITKVCFCGKQLLYYPSSFSRVQWLWLCLCFFFLIWHEIMLAWHRCCILCKYNSSIITFCTLFVSLQTNSSSSPLQRVCFMHRVVKTLTFSVMLDRHQTQCFFFFVLYTNNSLSLLSIM